MKKLDKIKFAIAITSLWLSYMAVLLILFWSFYPYKTSVQKQPYRVLVTELKQGDLLQYEMDYCKYTDIKATVNRQFVDGIIYSVPESTALLKKGCGTIINTLQIPYNLPPGKYYLNASVSFRMNPMRTITNEYKTEMFSVTK